MTFLELTPSGVGQVVTAYSRVVAGWSVMVDGLSLDVHGVSLGGICWGDFSLCRGRAGFDGGRGMPPGLVVFPGGWVHRRPK